MHTEKRNPFKLKDFMGVNTIEKLASWESEALSAMTTDFVKATGFPGIPPLPKEVSSTITNAKRLPKVVDW
jgi:hypothetical protein